MKKTGNRSARNAVLNLLVLPGLGSLLAGRRSVGGGQLLCVLAGSAMLLVWFLKVLAQYYGLMFGDVAPQSVGWIGETGGVLFVLSWLWAAVTSFSLFREAAAHEAQTIQKSNRPPQMKPSETQILSALAGMPEWKRGGQIISRTFGFADFPAAMKFVNAVAEIAEAAQHHPDVDIRWNQVTLALTTHATGGLTEKDFALAKQCDALSLR